MSHTHAPERAAWIGLLVLTIVWSLNWTVMKVATHYSGPFTFSAQRYVIGTVVLFALLALRRDPLQPTPWLPTIAIGLCQTCAFQALAQWALVSGGAGKTALLAYTMPFWVVPLAWWWLHEKPGPTRWLCIVVAAAGFACVVEPWRPLGAPHGIALALLAGLAWAVATVLSKRLFQRHPDVTPLRLTAWQMLIGTLGLVIVALVAPQRPLEWTGTYVAALLYNGLLSSGVCWVLWALVVQRLSANVAGLTSLAVPVAGVLFAWGLLHEQPSNPEWIGIALIGVALLALQFRRRVPA
ncbi:MAG: putative inner membrane transporter YijE [Rhodanobacteraceae bacterium]|jgi:drug/metabolite transporter (DMT)-like permease|nr:MAG: putative inner membrane transporter YijE [Rhodanobacteraceae bacterium]